MQIGPQANFWTLNLSWDPWVNHCIKPEDIKLSKMCHCRVRQSGGTGQSSWYCKHYSWGGYLRKKIPQALGFLEISRQRGEQTDVLQLCQMGTLQALNSEKSYWFVVFFSSFHQESPLIILTVELLDFYLHTALLSWWILPGLWQ